MKKTIFNFASSIITGIFLVLCASWTVAQTPTIATPDGYAGSSGTTGGGSTAPITVSTASAFMSAVGNNNSAVIIVNGRLNVGTVSIGSNKTIVGANSSSGLYGGAIKLQGSNYIIQNLIIGPNTGGDAMEVSGATKVFIHKCEFYDGADGNLDIVRGSDYVTVSWCKFYYVNQSSHKFTMLIGNGDNVTSDDGKLHITIHHSWFANGCVERMPRVRYGRVHIYNNYYNCVGNNYCIGTGYKCHIRVENTYFDNVDDPWADYGATSSGGEMGWSNLKFVNCSQPTYIFNSYPVFSVPYGFTADPVDNVNSIVRAGAGNVFNQSGYSITVMAWGTAGSEQITLAVGGTAVQTWTLGTSMGSYTATTSLSGAVTVEFINDDGTNRDVQIDYVRIGGNTYQAENQATNTGVWQNSSCGGSYSEWLHCNGYIGFSAYKNAGAENEPVANAYISDNIFIYPNPAFDELIIDLPEFKENLANIEVYSIVGVLVKNNITDNQTLHMDIHDLIPGYYMVKVNLNNTIYTKNFIKQ